MTKTIYIYGLKEVDSDEIRYVGQSVDVKNRHRSHVKNEENADEHPKVLWIENAKRRGVEIELVVLEECDLIAENEVEREQYWIDHFSSQGHRLTNLKRATCSPIRRMPKTEKKMIEPSLKEVICAAVDAPDIQQLPSSYETLEIATLDLAEMMLSSLKEETDKLARRIQKIMSPSERLAAIVERNEGD
jgi:hypothetical protein